MALVAHTIHQVLHFGGSVLVVQLHIPMQLRPRPCARRAGHHPIAFAGCGIAGWLLGWCWGARCFRMVVPGSELIMAVEAPEWGPGLGLVEIASCGGEPSGTIR